MGFPSSCCTIDKAIVNTNNHNYYYNNHYHNKETMTTKKEAFAELLREDKHYKTNGSRVASESFGIKDEQGRIFHLGHLTKEDITIERRKDTGDYNVYFDNLEGVNKYDVHVPTAYDSYSATFTIKKNCLIVSIKRKEELFEEVDLSNL